MGHPSVVVDIIKDFAPHEGERPGRDPIAAAEALPGLFAEGTTLYAVVDAALAPLLPERLERSGLAYRSLYRGLSGERLAEVAPYLVALDPDDTGISTDLFRHEPEDPNPAHLLSASAALLFRSVEPLDTMERHLRRMILLPDETGARMFMRLATPGALAAACLAAPPEEAAWVFDGIDALLWTRQSLEPGEWQLLEARPAPGLSGLSKRPLVLAPPVRRAMAIAVAEEKARALARAHADGLDERIARATSYTRMMAARYDNEGWLRTTHDLMSPLSEQDRAAAWRLIDSGAHSLGQAHARIAQSSGQEPILP